MRRLLSLDYLIERPTLGWLPTEAEKVQRFEALGIERRTFPYRLYGPHGKPQIPRYFAFKLPIAVDEKTATFVYVDAGQSTDSELRAWGMAHAPLWAALRARTFAVHVVAVGTGVAAAERAAPVLKHWTQDGDGQGAADPVGPTKADPDIRQEIARLETAITAGNRELMRAAGGFDKAADRLVFLQQLPDGTPTKATARGAIDRFTIWPTVRLTTPRWPSDGAPAPRPVPWQAPWQAPWQGTRTRTAGGCPKNSRGGVPSPPSIVRCRCSAFRPTTGRPEPRQR